MARATAKVFKAMPRVVSVCMAMVISACGMLPGKPTQPAMNEYALNAGFAPGPVGSELESGTSCLSAQVMLPRAAAGFNTSRMAYTQNQDRLNYYAYSQWIDTPSYMFQPLLVDALQRSGRFNTVVKSPSPVRTRYRLITDDLAVVQQIRGKSNVVLIGMRLQLLDMQDRILVIDEALVLEQSTEANPQAGVAAANAIARDLLALVAEKVRGVIDTDALCGQ